MTKKGWERISRFSSTVSLSHYHSVGKREILSHQKNISSNRLFSNSYNKTVPLLSRNFCHKCVRENSSNFHTVIMEITEIFSDAFLTKISWKQRFHKEVTKELISREKISVRENFAFFHTACVLSRLTTHLDFLLFWQKWDIKKWS